MRSAASEFDRNTVQVDFTSTTSLHIVRGGSLIAATARDRNKRGPAVAWMMRPRAPGEGPASRSGRVPPDLCASTAFASLSADDGALRTLSMCCTRERGTGNESTYLSCPHFRLARCGSLAIASLTHPHNETPMDQQSCDRRARRRIVPHQRDGRSRTVCVRDELRIRIVVRD